MRNHSNAPTGLLTTRTQRTNKENMRNLGNTRLPSIDTQSPASKSPRRFACYSTLRQPSSTLAATSAGIGMIVAETVVEATMTGGQLAHRIKTAARVEPAKMQRAPQYYAVRGGRLLLKGGYFSKKQFKNRSEVDAVGVDIVRRPGQGRTAKSRSCCSQHIACRAGGLPWKF